MPWQSPSIASRRKAVTRPSQSTTGRPSGCSSGAGPRACWRTPSRRLEAESTAAGKAALVSHLLPTLTGGRGDLPLAAIAAELGMTEGAVKMVAPPLRRRYGEILREEIAPPSPTRPTSKTRSGPCSRPSLDRSADSCDLGGDFPFYG